MQAEKKRYFPGRYAKFCTRIANFIALSCWFLYGKGRFPSKSQNFPGRSFLISIFSHHGHMMCGGTTELEPENLDSLYGTATYNGAVSYGAKFGGIQVVPDST